MKIGIVCYPTLGGSGIIATELGHELAMRGHEVHFITYEIPFRLRLEEKNIFFHEVEINQYDLFKYPDYVLTLAVKIASIAQRHQLDLLHVHYAIPHATSAYLAKQIMQKSMPVVTTLHGTDITLVGRDPSYFQIVKFSIEKSDGVTAVSKSLVEQTRHYFNIQKPIEVIYNFFIPKLELIGKKPLHDNFVEHDEKLLLHSSNYRPVKRTEDVLRIFMEVRKKVKCKLLFLGSGPGLEKLHQQVREEQLSKDVVFWGNSRNIDPYVASADLFLLPSAQESFGLAALEAMGYGVPVVASEAGGLPELIEQGKTGYLAPVGDVERMAKYAIELLTNPAAYQKMSQAARFEACEKFCTAKIIPQYEDYYKKMLNI